MESAVISGAGCLIGRHRPMLYGLGYRLFRHLPPLFNRQNWRGEPADMWGGTVSVNMLCIPRERQAGLTGFREITSPHDRWNLAPFAAID